MRREIFESQKYLYMKKYSMRYWPVVFIYIFIIYDVSGAKGDLDFRISDLVKNPDGTDI